MVIRKWLLDCIPITMNYLLDSPPKPTTYAKITAPQEKELLAHL